MENREQTINRPITPRHWSDVLSVPSKIDLEAMELLEGPRPPFGNIAWNLFMRSTMPLPLWLVSNIVPADPRGISQADLIDALVKVAAYLRYGPAHPDRRQEYLKILPPNYQPRHLRPYPT